MSVNVNVENRQIYKNISANILAFLFQFVTSFCVSPIIVEHVGASAYGFVNIANDFVSYAAIFASIINSVAARFIANEFYCKNYKKANYYFNSLIMANVILSAIIGIISGILIYKLEYILVIPTSLITDVKISFALVFASYIVTLITMVYSTSIFIVNRTDIQGVRNIIKSFLTLTVTIVFLIFVSVKIYWIALGTLVSSIVVAIMNIGLTNRITPMLKFCVKHVRIEYAIEVAKSGGWMAIISFSGVLLRGIDLTLANILLGDYEMGLLSIARTMPNNMISVIGTLAPIFTPVFIAFHAQGKKRELVEKIDNSINIISLIIFVPISIFIVYSVDFYMLWQRGLKQEEVYVVSLISIISIMQSYFDASTATMSQVSVVVNKLRIPVLVSLGCGVASVGMEIFLLKYTDMGIYAIVLPTTIVLIARYIFFNPIYVSYCLSVPIKTFYYTSLKNWISIPVLIVIMKFIRKGLPIKNWWDLILNIGVCFMVGELIMLVLYRIDIVKKGIGICDERRRL